MFQHFPYACKPRLFSSLYSFFNHLKRIWDKDNFFTCPVMLKWQNQCLKKEFLSYDRLNPSLQVLFFISLKPQLNPSFIQSQSLETHLTSPGLRKCATSRRKYTSIGHKFSRTITNTENKTKSQKEINQQSQQQKNFKKTLKT